MYVRNENRTSQLRAAIEKGPVALPGAINALTGKVIEQADFESIYLSGPVLANSVGVMTLSEARQHASSVASVAAAGV